MFNPLRLLRRKPYIDDAATAFIEGRATEHDDASLRERETRTPGLRRDLESIRETVSLLRSVGTVSAPRSFALSHVPAPARRARKPRLAMAPAVFAVAAALAVGLLAVGNVVDVVRQSDGGSVSQTAISSGTEPDVVTASGDASRGAAGATATILPAESGSATQTEQGILDDSARLEALAPPATAQATGTPAPLPTSADSFDGSAPAAVAGPQGTAGGSDQAASAIVENGTGSQTLPDETSTITVLPENSDGKLGITTESATAVTSGVAGETGRTPQPLPEMTVTGPAVSDDADALTLARVEPDGESPASELEDRRSGFAIPLWQLQVGFAGLSILMAGAWMLLQRRLTEV